VLNFDSKYIHAKNTFKTVLGRSEVEINNFLCFDHLLSFWPYDGRRVYDGRRIYDNQFGSFGKTFAKKFAQRSALARGAP
jgi:hypothetical protein